MEQKNVKNKGMSSPYKWFSIEVGFKPSAHYAMNYNVVDQFRYVWHKLLLCFFVLSAISLYCTFGSLSSEQPLSSGANTGHWE